MNRTLVGIPVYNGADCIVDSIDSCLNQTSTVNILIIDNCSNDGTVNLVRQKYHHLESITLLENKTNVGRVGNWNKCLDYFENSSFLYFKFLFPGDLLPQDSIEKSENYFDSYDVDVVCGRYEHVLNNGLSKFDRNGLKPGFYNFQQLIDHKLYPSRVTGCFNKWIFSRKSLNHYRFNELFLGGHTFSNNLIFEKNVYFTDDILGKFVQKHHKSFHKQADLSYHTEYLYTFNLGLEKSRMFHTNFIFRLRRLQSIINFLKINFISNIKGLIK